MATRWILGFLVLSVAKFGSVRSETITLTDDVCGNTYFTTNTNYLVWDGSHIGQDSLMNLWDGSIVKKDSGSCKVSFDPTGTSEVCVTVEEFHIEDCNATLNYYHSDEFSRKATYSCNTTPDSFCRTGSGVEVEIAYKGKAPPGSSNYFKLKITSYEKENWLTWIILASLVGVTIIIAIVMIFICRRKRSQGVVFQRSEIPHTRLVNEPTEPTPPTHGNSPPAYPMNQPATREYSVTIPVAVNLR